MRAKGVSFKGAAAKLVLPALVYRGFFKTGAELGGIGELAKQHSIQQYVLHTSCTERERVCGMLTVSKQFV